MGWVAAVLELAGKWLVGNECRWGFVASSLGALVWITVALRVPEARGLLLVCLPAIIINVRNFVKWGKR